MRRDLDIDCDPAELVLAPPDRSTHEGDLPPLRVPQPPAAGRRARRRAAGRRAGARSRGSRRRGIEGRPPGSGAWPPSSRRTAASRSPSSDAPVVVTGELDGLAAALRDSDTPRRARERRLALASCGAPASSRRTTRRSPRTSSTRTAPGYAPRRPRGRVRARGADRTRPPSRRPRRSSAGRPSTLALVRSPARAPRGARARSRLYRDVELPLSVVLRSMEDAGVRIDTYRMGEITARLADQVEELEARAQELAGEPFLLGSTQQVARILFETLGLEPGRKGKTGYSTDTRVLRGLRDDSSDRARDRGVARVLEAAQHLPRARCPSLISADDGRLHTTFNQTVASTGRLSTSNPNLQSIPIRTELGRSIRSAFVAEPGWQARLRGLLAGRAAHPRPRLGRAEAARGVRARRRHPRRDGGRGARQGPGVADEGRAQPREGRQLRDHLRHLRVRALRPARHPAGGGAGLHRRLPRALPARAGLHRPNGRAGRAGRLRSHAARPPPTDPGAAEPRTARRARWASGSPSTRSCRARPPT